MGDTSADSATPEPEAATEPVSPDSVSPQLDDKKEALLPIHWDARGCLTELEVLRLKEVWLLFDNFREDMLPRAPTDKLDVPRKNYLCRDGYLTTNEFGVLLKVARDAQIDKSGALKDIEIQSYVDSSEGPEAMPRSRLAGPSQEVLNDEELKFGLGYTNLWGRRPQSEQEKDEQSGALLIDVDSMMTGEVQIDFP